MRSDPSFMVTNASFAVPLTRPLISNSMEELHSTGLATQVAFKTAMLYTGMYIWSDSKTQAL